MRVAYSSIVLVSSSPRSSVPARHRLLVLALFLVSGNPALPTGGVLEVGLLLLMFVLVMAFLVRGRSTVSRRLVALVFLFVGLFLYQTITIGMQPVSTMAGFFVRLVIAYGATALVTNFSKTYVTIAIYLSFMALVFFTVDQALFVAGLDLRSALAGLDLVGGAGVHLGVHNLVGAPNAHRNAGIFWEPAALGGYVLVALVLLSIPGNERNVKSYYRDAIVLIATVLSTQSTAAYLLLPLVIVLHWRVRGGVSVPRRAIPVTVFVILAIFGIAMYQIWSLDFVSPKMLRQYQIVELRAEGWQLTRFGSLVLDWEFIQERPVAGWGLHETTRRSLETEYWSRHRMGNGFSGFAVSFGVVGLAAAIACMALSFRSIFRDPVAVTLALTTTVLLLNVEMFLNFPAFLALLFLVPDRPVSDRRDCESEGVWRKLPIRTRYTSTPHSPHSQSDNK